MNESLHFQTFSPKVSHIFDSNDRAKLYFLPHLQRFFKIESLEDFSLEELKDGSTNTLYKCKILLTNQIVLLRIYGEKTDYFIDRESEIKILNYLVEKNLFPAFYGDVPGGLAYG
jgi:hypothetical protein